MRRKQMQCRASGCNETRLHLGGLCRRHHEESVVREARRSAALDALETITVDGRLIQDERLREEVLRLRERWDQACRVVQWGKGETTMPLDEAEYALEWCISLAQELVDAEVAARDLGPPPARLDATRDWVWDRFRNLDAGLRSNGLARRD